VATTGTRIVCNTTQLCGTGVICGQGPYQELWALYSTSDVSVNTPTWIDASSKVRQFNTSRGRDNELADIDAGTATIVVDNRNRTFDPTLNPSIKPMNRWWIRAQFSGATQDMFVGYAESIDNVWPDQRVDAVAVISCVDEFKLLALENLPTTNPPRDTYGDLVLSDQPAGYWKMDEFASAVDPAEPAAGSKTFLESSVTGGPALGIVQSAIAGSNSVARRFVSSASDTIMTTGALVAGEPGNVDTLTEFTIELWFQTTTATPSGGDTLIRGPAAGGNDQYSLVLNASGTLTLNARNSVPTLFSISSGLIAANRWYHVVGAISGGSLRLYLDGVQVASTAWTGSFAAMTAGEALELMDGTLVAGDRYFDEFAVYRYGLTAARVLAHYQAGMQRGFARGQLPGDRANAVLDSVTSHAPRNIRAGTRIMTGAYMTGQATLDELRKSRSAENVDALLFIGRDGTVVLLDAAHRSVSPWNTVQATFDDDGTDLPYMDLNVDYSETFLVNEWNVTGGGLLTQVGLTQTASDSASISAYKKRPQSITELPITLDSDASNVATALLAKTKDPMLRVTSITPKMANKDAAEAAFARDLGDRIRVFRTPPGGGARIDQTLFIQKIEISGDASSPVWNVSLGVSPL
jgi:hypothetical protein